MVQNNKGITLMEVLIVLLIIILLAAASGATFYSSIQLQKLKNCANKIMSDIQYIRTVAQNGGSRAVLQLTSNIYSEDIDGDGYKEYYIAFLDNNKNGSYDASIDTIKIHGSQNNALCSNNIQVDPGTSLNPRKIIFDPLGFLKLGAGNRNIFLKIGKQAIRIEIVSLTGMLRYYLNRNNCNDDNNSTCSINDEWTELK